MNQDKIGKYIKKLRIDNHFTQKDLADKLGVTYQAVSKWENGKNIPDISVLKEMSNLFNVEISEILNGENNLKHKKSNNIVIIVIILFLLLIGLIIILSIRYKNNTYYEFKELSTTCNNFKISGVAAYNNDKTSIYISNIEFCGGDDKQEYKTINCILYEDYKDISTKVSTCPSKNNITLEEYLKEVLINVDNYSSMCKLFKNSNLYLEIQAVDNNDKTISYKIPIKLNKDCNK